MVVGFRRTISFPAPKSAATTSPAARPSPSPSPSAFKSSYRVRSASLPCRFHPLVVHLDDDVATLRLLTGNLTSTTSSSPSSIAAAAAQLAAVLTSLSDLLHHPQAEEPLRRLRLSSWSSRLLDAFLLLADAHGSFRDALASLSHLASETRAAARRADLSRLSSASRAQRRADRDLSRLAASSRSLSKSPPPIPTTLSPGDSAAALAAAISDATAASASASAAIFAAIAALSSASTSRLSVYPSWLPVISPATPARTMHVWWVADLCRWMRRAKKRSAKKTEASVNIAPTTAAASSAKEKVETEEEEERKAAMERLDGLEECIREVESSGEKVFRALVNNRVSLLNILTPSF